MIMHIMQLGCLAAIIVYQLNILGPIVYNNLRYLSPFHVTLFGIHLLDSSRKEGVLIEK